MGIKKFIENNHYKKHQETIIKAELEKLKSFFYDIDSINIDDIELFFQNIENKKAQVENRDATNIEIRDSIEFVKQDDFYDVENNTIVLHFPNRNTPEQLYASFIHESNHANQKHLREQNSNGLSEFDRNCIIANKLAQDFNIADTNGEISRQYLYNYNELDSKVEELKAFIECIKLNDNFSDSVKHSCKDMLDGTKIYNFIEYKLYEHWQISLYNKYHDHPEKDSFRIMPSILKTEKELDINAKKFILEHQKDLSYAKFKELISLRKEIKEIYLLMENTYDQELRNKLIKDYFKQDLQNNKKSDIIKEEQNR